MSFSLQFLDVILYDNHRTIMVGGLFGLRGNRT